MGVNAPSIFVIRGANGTPENQWYTRDLNSLPVTDPAQRNGFHFEEIFRGRHFILDDVKAPQDYLMAYTMSTVNRAVTFVSSTYRHLPVVPAHRYTSSYDEGYRRY